MSDADQQGFPVAHVTTRSASMAHDGYPAHDAETWEWCATCRGSGRVRQDAAPAPQSPVGESFGVDGEAQEAATREALQQATYTEAVGHMDDIEVFRFDANQALAPMTDLDFDDRPEIIRRLLPVVEPLILELGSLRRDNETTNEALKELADELDKEAALRLAPGVNHDASRGWAKQDAAQRIRAALGRVT